MENCVAPGLDAFDVLLEVVLSLVRVHLRMEGLKYITVNNNIYKTLGQNSWAGL